MVVVTSFKQKFRERKNERKIIKLHCRHVKTQTTHCRTAIIVKNKASKKVCKTKQTKREGKKKGKKSNSRRKFPSLKRALSVECKQEIKRNKLKEVKSAKKSGG